MVKVRIMNDFNYRTLSPDAMGDFPHPDALISAGDYQWATKAVGQQSAD
jgi:hypothetical protein